MANTTVTIYRADGAELMTAPVTDGAQLECKLMDKDEMTLSWVSAEAALIPMGAYAACPLNGKRYHMADPYWPQQKDVGLYEYKPTFKSSVFLLDKVPLMLYARDASGAAAGAECDWSFTGRGEDLFTAIEAAIREGLGEDWEIAADGEFEAALTLSFSNASVLSALNSVAEAWDAEWWYEDMVGGDGGRRITFGRTCARGPALPLTAGVEIECPQSNQRNTLYNRFYVFGGTRNIPQDYNGAQANSVVSKRLTLNPSKYPQGYIDLPLFDADGNAAVDGDGNLVADTSAESAGRRFSKVLQFDDIYPHCGCRIKFGTLHSVQRYVRDADDQKVRLADGTYDSWRLYAFALEHYDDAAGEWRDFRLDKTTYDKDSNPGGNLIKGLTLSLHFKSGALEGREFEAVYHDAAKAFRSEDGTEGFTAGEGWFEVVHAEDNTVVLPGPGIAPKAATARDAHDGDEVVVFNIRMPQEYYSAAYAELERAAVEAIWEEVKDANEYTVKGNRVHFHDNDPGLTVGRLVRLTVGGRSIDTRVTALTVKIGAPYDLSITFCKALAKGKISTLLTRVEAARQDIVEVAVADEAKVRASRQRLYAAQREMVDAMFDTDGYLTAPISPSAVETAVLKTGAASANFQLARVVFEANYNDGAADASCPDHFRASAGTLVHYGLGGDGPREWAMAAADLSDELTDDAAPYYLYAKCVDGGSAGVFTLSTEQVRFDERLQTEGCYYFLAGILSSVQTDGDGSFRVLNCTYGSTTVSGRFIKTGRIESVDSSTGIDLDKGVIFGNIQLASSASDDANKQFIDSLLGYSTGKAAMEGDIAAATNAAATAIASASSAQSAASAANDKVDNLKVGGRNYLLKTGAAWSVPGKGSGASENYTVYNYKASSDEAFKKGVTATISFDYDNGVTGGAANILVHNMWSLLIALTPSNTGSGRFSKTLALTADVALSHPIYIQGKWDGSFTISNAKWETGNVPTSWTPAPEDVDEAIEAAKAAAVEEVDVMYAIGASSTTAPTSGWQTAAPAWEGGKYMWQRTDITTGDGVRHTGTPTCIQGAAGATGAAGRGIKGVQEQYYLSTSKTAQEGGSWQTAQPTWSAGKYVWTRSLITYSDGTTGYSAATLSELFNKANETAASAQTTAATAKDAVDNMEVGGRNYILKTSTPSVYKSVTTSQFVTRLGMISAGLAQRQVAMGEHITVSFEFRTDGKVDGGGSQWIVINGSGQWRTLGYTAQFEDTAGAWVRREHTWKWGDSFSQSIKDAPKDLTVDDEFVIGCNPSSSVVNIEIRRLKLEVGNKRTDWAPAPEDTDAAIDKAQAAADGALALTGDPDNLFSDQFLFNLSNSTAVTPPKGKARLCNNRDNVFGNEIAVTPGAKVTIEAVLLRHPSDTSGIPPRFGLWYTDTDDGVDAYVDYNLATDIGAVGMTDDWHKWRRVFSVPSGVRKGRFFLQINNHADGDNTQGAFYASSVVVKMETRDYLREALEEASSGTTDVSGGLVLSTMMSVRDAGGVMVAGMSGAAAAAETGALPMIWAGADENSTAGIGAADFRVYKDGGIVMHSAQILGKAGEPAVTVSKGNISVGTMNDAGDGLASVGTEIIPDSYASVAAVLNGLAGSGGTLGGTNTYTKTLTVGTHTLNTAGLAVRLYGTTVTTTLCGGTTEAAGTIWAGFTAGTYRLAGKVTAYSGANDKRLLMASLTFSFRVYLKVGESYVQIASGDGMDRQTNSGTSATTLTLTMSESGSLSTATKSLPFSKGQAWSVVVAADYTVESIYYAVLPPTTLNVATSPSVTLSSATLKVSDVQAAYRNKIFRNGLVMSKSNANYLVVASDSSSPLVEARAGTSTTANAGVRLAAGGLQVNYDGTASSAWHEAFPLYAVVKVTFTTNVAGSPTPLYNPHDMAGLSWVRDNTGVYFLKWTTPSGLTLYPHFQAVTSAQRYVSVRSIAANSIKVGISDDDTVNDMATGDMFLVFLYKF